MTVRNPNKRIGIYYDQIEAQALYAGQVFGMTIVTGFYQGHKETDYLNPVFKGQNSVVLKNDDFSKFDLETPLENFSIDIKLDLKVRLKFFLFKTPKLSPKIECDLKVPLDSDGKAVTRVSWTSDETGMEGETKGAEKVSSFLSAIDNTKSDNVAGSSKLLVRFFLPHMLVAEETDFWD
ncbi:hypothetical protein AgCh_005015 [Apium graveolens]